MIMFEVVDKRNEMKRIVALLLRHGQSFVLLRRSIRFKKLGVFGDKVIVPKIMTRYARLKGVTDLLK